MDKSDIHPGDEYGVREPAKAGVELQHVKVLEHVRGGKWKVEWIDPNAGLVDYVKSMSIVVPWKDRRAFLRDEGKKERLLSSVEYSGFPGQSHPTADAVSEVFDFSGERGIYVHQGVMSFEPDALERIADRAGVAVPTHPHGYTDRQGTGHLPWECALELAMQFARAEPRTVLDPIEAYEIELSEAVRSEHSPYMIRALNEQRASWALIRQWAGLDEAIAIREDRIKKLERALSDVRWSLVLPNPDVQQIVRKIERALR